MLFKGDTPTNNISKTRGMGRSALDGQRMSLLMS